MYYSTTRAVLQGVKATFFHFFAIFFDARALAIMRTQKTGAARRSGLKDAACPAQTDSPRLRAGEGCLNLRLIL